MSLPANGGFFIGQTSPNSGASRTRNLPDKRIVLGDQPDTHHELWRLGRVQFQWKNPQFPLDSQLFRSSIRPKWEEVVKSGKNSLPMATASSIWLRDPMRLPTGPEAPNKSCFSICWGGRPQIN